jgi:hypothetical protein
LRTSQTKENKGLPTIGSIVCKEGSKNAAFSGATHDGMVEGVYKRRHTEDVGEKDELLSHVRARLSHGGQELDRFRPFFRRDAKSVLSKEIPTTKKTILLLTWFLL